MALQKLDRGTGRVTDVREMIYLTNSMRKHLDNYTRSIGFGRVTKFSENFIVNPKITIKTFSMDYLSSLDQKIIDKYISELSGLGFHLGFRKKNNKRIFFIKRDRRNRDVILDILTGSNISDLVIKSNWARVQEISFSASEDFLVKGSFAEDKEKCWIEKYYKNFVDNTGFLLQTDSSIESEVAILNFAPIVKINKNDDEETLKKLNEKNEYTEFIKYTPENIYRIIKTCKENGLGSNVYFRYEKISKGTYITGFTLRIA